MKNNSRSSELKCNNLQPEQWILLVSILLLLLLIIIALNPDSVEQHRIVNQTSVQAQAPAQGQTIAILQPFKVNKPIAYQGKVERIINRDPGGWGQIHIFVRDRVGNRQQVSLSPKWYLEFQGCRLKVGQNVIGEMFNASKGTEVSTVYYAKNIIINKVRCRLRTVDGFALWSDQLQ